MLFMANFSQKSSNFAQTCNLLSQYLKEGGNFGDINLGINGKPEVNKGPDTSTSSATTLKLLSNMENLSDHDQTSRQKAVASANMMKSSMDFLPDQFMGFGPPNSVEVAINRGDLLRKSSTMDSGTSQMTIFYAGKVTIFNDFPPDKVKEIMGLISSNHFPSEPVAIKRVNSINSSAALDSSTSAHERVLQLQTQANGPDVPPARRASLHRFFAKRKDRVAAKAPYQINNPQDLRPTTPTEADHNPFVAFEGQSSKQLELKL